MLIIHAEKRDPQAKAKQIRKSGMTPANLYGHGIRDSVLLQIPRNGMQKLVGLRSVDVTVTLEVEGEKTVALLREVSASPRTRQVQNFSFQKISENEFISSSAQIVLLNPEIPSAYVQQDLYEVPYRALGSNLIEKIEVDLKGAEIGYSMRVEDLDIAKNPDITLLIDPQTSVLSVVENFKPSVEPEEEVAAEEPETE